MVDLADVRAAAARLEGVAHRTPVFTSTTLNGRVGASVFLKAESLQRSGSFKFRGAYNTLAGLDPADRAGGVVAFSSGNHAQAVALAASLLGIRATIVRPTDAPELKRRATEGYGATVVGHDRFTESREAIAASLAEETGATLVPPFDHPSVIAGQGTVALELFEDVPGLDVLVVCIGGGGLVSGCAVAARGLAPGVRVVGVEPAAGDDVARSLAAGRRVEIAVPETIADGQQTTAPGELTFPIIRELVEAIALVTDGEIVEAMVFAFERLKLVLEPSGASALAALLAGKVDVGEGRVGVTLSGGNISPQRFANLTS